MNRSVYLAGPITGLSYMGATDWREYAAILLRGTGITPISPMRAKSYLAGEEELAQSYSGHALSTPKGIVTRDRFDCQRAGVVLANLLGASRVSIGTMVELGWADAARVPIVTVLPENDNIHNHAFIHELSGFVVPTLTEGLTLVRHILSV